jgi:hypothetical protein
MAMKSTSLSLIGALALAGAAYGQQPPDVVTSDAFQNTAMGTGALISRDGNSCGPVPPSGCSFGNTASGYEALYSNLGGIENTAVGTQALYSNTTMGVPGGPFRSGIQNTAVGYQALYSTINAFGNTALGYQALYSSTTVLGNSITDVFIGQFNTAVGNIALFSNTTGSNNTAVGNSALCCANYQSAHPIPVTGSNNTGIGAYALFSYSTGSDNVAAGFEALFSNTTGQYNTASGYGALYSNINGVSNIATGYEALYSNTSGNHNTASGTNALHNNTTGSQNTAFGYHAGANLTTGSNNVDIGSPGAAGDNNAIKIGVQGTQTATFIAGIYGHSLTGSAVVVNSTGQLGVVASSERFKTGIAPMGSNTAKLGQLRPVTFKLKSDATGTRQYGLIAEEVAKVYPELVVRDQKGRIDGVRYDELAPMLLNEVQKQAAEIRELKQQQKQSVTQAQQLRDVQRQLAELHAALAKLQSKDELVAHR